jgi:hypothetical protein
MRSSLIKVIKAKCGIKYGECLAESKELEDFVRSICDSLQKGLTEGLEIKFPIEFEIAVVLKKANDEMISLLVVDDSGNYHKQEISRIKFKIGKKEAHSDRIRFFRE